jgi:hypothetical protein
VTRRPDLAEHAGRFVALSVPGDEVVAVADTPAELFRVLDERRIGRVTIMRAPKLDEPVYVGLG